MKCTDWGACLGSLVEVFDMGYIGVVMVNNLLYGQKEQVNALVMASKATQVMTGRLGYKGLMAI